MLSHPTTCVLTLRVPSRGLSYSLEASQEFCGVSFLSTPATFLRSVLTAFLRSLSIHLQICWQVVPGRKFFWSSILAGWGIPAIILAVSLSITGISYRFGGTCHINHDRALDDYWGPLLAFAAASVVLQFITFGYCIRVYLRALLNDSSINSQSQASAGGLPSYNSRNGSIKTVTPGQAYRRVKKVIALQWRATVIVLIIIIDVIFLAVVFVQMDNTVAAAMQDLTRAQPWLLCLVLNNGDKKACLDKVRAAHLVTKEATTMAVLFILSLNGIWVILFLGRTSMISGWLDLMRRHFQPSRTDFVSVDAHRFSAVSGAPSSTKQYELITSPSKHSPSMPNNSASMPLKAQFETGIKSGASSPAPFVSPRDGLSPLPQSPRSSSSVYRDSTATDYFSKSTEAAIMKVHGDATGLGLTSGTDTQTTSIVSKDFEYGNNTQMYRSPKLSFSTPRPPSAGRTFSRESSLSRPYSLRRDSLPYSQRPLPQQSPPPPNEPLPRPPATLQQPVTAFHPSPLQRNPSRGGNNATVTFASFSSRAPPLIPASSSRPTSPPTEQQRRTDSPGGASVGSSREWDPSSTYAPSMQKNVLLRPSYSATSREARVRSDGLGKILGKDEGF